MAYIRSCLIMLILFYSLPGCDYARMKDQESIRTYETELPEMPAQSIPLSGGVTQLINADFQRMSNPLPATNEVIVRGRRDYECFCIMCHGADADGNGTVGQSFAPLPTDLKSGYVQNQADGILFYRINFGYRRHPPLYRTLGQETSWGIIRYLRSLRPG